MTQSRLPQIGITREGVQLDKSKRRAVRMVQRILHERLPDFWSSEVIACLYLCLFVFSLTRVTRRAANYTRLYTLYTRLVLVGSFFRVLYFAIPGSLFGVPFVPTNFARFDNAWWGNAVDFIGLMLLGNLFFYFTFVLLVYYWASVCEDSKAVPVRLFRTIAVSYGLGYAAVIACYVFIPFARVLFVSSIVQALFAVVLIVQYGWYASRLLLLLSPSWHSNASLVNASKRRSESDGGSRAASNASSAKRSPPWESSRLSYDAGETEHATARSLSTRMRRITTVAAVVLLCCLVRGFILAYQAILSFQMWNSAPGALDWSPVWWVIIAFFYVVCEIGCTTCVLIIMKPRPKPPTPLLADAHRSHRRAQHGPYLTSGGVDEDDVA